jgi:hypothetical protein
MRVAKQNFSPSRGAKFFHKKLEEGGTHYTPDAQLVQRRIIETTRRFVATSQLLAA